MRVLALISLRRIRITLSFLVFFGVISCELWGQSGLRSSPLKRAQERQEKFENSEPVQKISHDVDQRLGRIVWADKTSFAAVIINVNRISNYQELYYVCNLKGEAVAIAESLNLKNKHTAIFSITEGSVKRGDFLYLKQIPPRKNAQKVD